MIFRTLKKYKNVVRTTLGLSIFCLILFSNINISFAGDSENCLVIPLNFQTFEFSDKIGTINNISSVEIELPSSTWDITHLELNFTNIEYYMREIVVIEDNAIKDDLFLDKQNVEGLGVQIELNESATIFGVYLNIKTSQTHAMDEVTVQIKGYNSSINAPNSTFYGYVDLNYSIADGWNYQNFTTPITLPKGNYYLVLEGSIQASGVYHWYYNDLNPNNPDLYISENHGAGWINGTQGSPFLYKLVQEVKKKDLYPEEFNMTADIMGDCHTIQNGAHIGSGTLNLPDIELSPYSEILHIPIIPYEFFFTLSYHVKLKNQFLSNAFINITEREDNFWKIIPDINRCNDNYCFKFEFPSNWYNIMVFKDNIDITSSEHIIINENSLYVLNNTINEDAKWEITANSPKIDFTVDLSRGTEFQLGQELVFSAIAPTQEGNFTFILYNKFGAEIDKTIIPVTSDETLYSFDISSTASLGNWTAYIYWNSYNDASVKSQVFTIVPASSSQKALDIIPILILAIIIGAGSVSGSFTVYQTVKKQKRKSEIKLKNLANKCKDILSLNYLMISDIKSGVNVYEQIFARKTIDPSLISGFLDAIRNFGVELTGSYRKSETLTLDYEDSIILMYEAIDFRLIIVMSDKPSDEFINSITDLARDIEEGYGGMLREFRGGAVAQFTGIRDLIELHLNVSFTSALKIVINKKVKLNTLEKSVIQKASEIMEQTNLNYFYTTFLMDDQQFDPDMTKTIFDLINKKVFQPISLNLED